MLKELGSIKTTLSKPLKTSENIKVMLLGKKYKEEYEDIEEAMGLHVFDSLFIQGAEHILTEKGMYIFYDIDCPVLHTSVKNLRITMHLLCERALLRDFKDLTPEIVKNYPGNRIDKLAAMIDELIIGNKTIALKPGIGAITLDSVQNYNLPKYYGKTFIFTIPNFR